MKLEHKNIDYCPCSECDERWVKEPDYSMGKFAASRGFSKIKNGIKYQYKKRAENIPEDIKMEFFKLMSEGKNLGQAREAVGIGLGVASELISQRIELHKYYSFNNPYTGQTSYDSPKSEKLQTISDK